jgi:hypothetical protein
MSKQLRPEDRRAVDLYFDRGASLMSDSDGGSYIAPGDVQPKRLEAVETVLSVLSAMSAAEPPADLATRTMQHIATAQPHPVHVQQPRSQHVVPPRPTMGVQNPPPVV